LIVLAPQLVVLLLRHGRFTADDARAVTALLRVFAIGLVGSMGAMLVERWYMAGSRNRLLAGLSLIRAATRLVVVLTLLNSEGLLAFGVGYTAAEWTYLVILSLMAVRVQRVSGAPGT
jgi:peptidoglycan biosynthesis protein MviN/MurJ (putative lipid II flippase)